MSRFIEEVKGELLRENRRAGRMFPVSCERIINPVPYQELVGYKISVTFGRTGHCRPQDLQQATENVVRELREAVYGDIKKRILDLERAMVEHDIDKMYSAMRDINKEIFG